MLRNVKKVKKKFIFSVYFSKKCILKEEEINRFLSNKKRKYKEKTFVYSGVNEFNNDNYERLERHNIKFSSEIKSNKIKLSIEQQIKETEIFLNSERKINKTTKENIDNYFSNEELRSIKNLNIEEINTKHSYLNNNEKYSKYRENEQEFDFKLRFNDMNSQATSLINKTRELLSSHKFSNQKKISLPLKNCLSLINENVYQSENKNLILRNNSFHTKKFSVGGNLDNNLFAYSESIKNQIVAENLYNNIPSSKFANYKQNTKNSTYIIQKDVKIQENHKFQWKNNNNFS